MRSRQLRERRESTLKRALTDLQFIAELGVLTRAAEAPELTQYRDTAAQLQALAECGWMPARRASALVELWRQLLARRHLDWLERQPGQLESEAMEHEIDAAWQACFGTPRSKGG